MTQYIQQTYTWQELALTQECHTLCHSPEKPSHARFQSLSGS